MRGLHAELNMPQTEYKLDMTPVFVGQVVDRRRMSGAFECSEDIPFGRVVELHTDGKWRLPQGTTLGKYRAIAQYNSSYPPGGYKAGDQVAFLREGAVWAEYDGGGSPDPTAAINVRHSSTVETHRGKVTASATSATAGSEISALGGAEFQRKDAGSSMALLIVNFAANAGG